MHPLSTQIPSKYEAPLFSAKNIRNYCESSIVQLEQELARMREWKIEDADELHHIHIRDVAVRNLLAEINLLKGLYAVAELVDFSDIVSLPPGSLNELYVETQKTP